MPIQIRRRSAFLAAPLVLPAGVLAQGVPVNAAEEGLTRQKPLGRTREARVVLSGQAAFGGQALQYSSGYMKMSCGSALWSR